MSLLLKNIHEVSNLSLKFPGVMCLLLIEVRPKDVDNLSTRNAGYKMSEGIRFGYASSFGCLTVITSHRDS